MTITHPTPAEASQDTRPPPRSSRVLLVEDDADVAMLLNMLLVKRGFVVTLAPTVAAALAAIASAPVDVVISDLRLPDGTGEELLRQLRAAGHVPAIALSGLVDEASVARARAAGFDEHLAKPVGIEHLVAAVRRVARVAGG